MASGGRGAGLDHWMLAPRLASRFPPRPLIIGSKAVPSWQFGTASLLPLTPEFGAEALRPCLAVPGESFTEFAYAVPTQSIFASFCGAQKSRKQLILLACPAGIEPATLGLEDRVGICHASQGLLHADLDLPMPALA